VDTDTNHKALAEVGEKDFQKEVLNSPQPTLVGFGAPWSKPCLILREELLQVAAHCAGKVRVLWVNVDDNPDLGAWYEIESIPLLLCFVGGKICARIVGTASKLEPLVTGI
jgi:thioredoxin 1